MLLTGTGYRLVIQRKEKQNGGKEREKREERQEREKGKKREERQEKVES